MHFFFFFFFLFFLFFFFFFFFFFVAVQCILGKYCDTKVNNQYETTNTQNIDLFTQAKPLVEYTFMNF